MPHERQNLRAAIVAQLKGPLNNRTSAGARVYANRMHPLRVADLPVVLVFIESETVGEVVRGPRELKRIAAVKIEGWVMTPPGIATDDALDAMALQIEAAMDLDIYHDKNAFTSVLANTEIGIKIDGEQSMGAVSLTYDVTYHSQLRNAVPTSMFATANARISQAPGSQAPLDQVNSTFPIPIT